MSKQRKWTADEVKQKLRARHPATQRMGARTIPGPWTCIEEWGGIDLLALAATSSAPNGAGSSSPPGLPRRYSVIGYEVKVSRSDYRAELRKPSKRLLARDACHRFYFAVPAGLLREDELEARDQPSLEAPELYVPDDVGLVTVDGRGTKVVKEAPRNHAPEPIEGLEMGGIGALARWISARPDPRHDGVVERARERGREIAAIHRGAA